MQRPVKSLPERSDNTGMEALRAIERRLSSRTFALALFLTFAGGFLVDGILDLRETRRVAAEGERARGKVIGRHKNGGKSTSYVLDIEFQTSAGVRVTSTESVGKSRYERTRPGDTLPLHYLASDPSVMKIGAKPELDPRGFIGSFLALIGAGVFYFRGKRREAVQPDQPAPSPAQPWVARLRPREVLFVLGAAGAGIALALLLIPRVPPRSRHEYLLEGQVLSIALDRKEASIKHDAISGFSPATTTIYTVPDTGQLTALKPGDLIRATLVVVRDEVHLDRIRPVRLTTPERVSAR